MKSPSAHQEKDSSMAPRVCKDRKEDTLLYKIGKIATTVAAVGCITGATVKLLSYEFVKAEEFKNVKSSIDLRINKVENDQTRVIQKLDDVGSDVKEIKRVLLRR